MDRPRVPLPVAMTLYNLTRSGCESEIIRFGVSFYAPFKESEQLWSHKTNAVTGVETDQPRCEIIVYTIQFSKAQKRALTMIALTSDTFLSSFAFSLYAFYQRKTLRV